MKPSQLLEEPSRWCRLALARDCDGKHCGIWAPGSVKWCLESAMRLYTGLTIEQQKKRFRSTPEWAQWCSENAKDTYPDVVCEASFNDTVKHAFLMSALRNANL